MLKTDGQLLITIICLFVAVIAWGIRLESKVEASIIRFEEHLEFFDKQILLIRRDIERLEDNQ